MAVSRALRRLLRIRELEEEQSRLALESALGEIHRLEHAMTAALERNRRGRKLFLDSAQSGQLTDRLAGLEEMRSAVLHAAALEPRIDAMSAEVAERRQEFLSKRVERRQAETLIQKSEEQEAIEAGRRAQQSLDDWYNSRMHRGGNDEKEESASDLPAVAEFVAQAGPAVEPPRENKCSGKISLG